MVKIILPILAVVSTTATQFSSENLQKWADYKHKFNKNYVGTEDSSRARTFFKNLESHKTGKFIKNGINQFSDLTKEEFLDKFTLINQPYPEDDEQFECPEKFNETITYPELPEIYKSEFDWRNPSKNHLNVVADLGAKNQESCGSCYAFSAVAAMEGNLCKQGAYDCDPDSPDLWQGISEQNVLDCGSYRDSEETRPWYSFGGCHGGWQANVFQYVYKTGGISHAVNYPYESGNSTAFDNGLNIGECRFEKENNAGFPDKNICGTVNKYGPVDQNTDLMKLALFEKGPLAVSLWVNGTWRDYESGLYTHEQAELDCNVDHTISHCVTVVGWGTWVNPVDPTDKRQYWIVKNSWGPTWGENGYINMEMGYNSCGVEGNVQYANMMVPEVEPEVEPEAPTDAMPTDGPVTESSSLMSLMSFGVLGVVLSFV